jgi:hypothetical protein
MAGSALKRDRAWCKILLVGVCLSVWATQTTFVASFAPSISTPENSIDAIACAASAAQDILAVIGAANSNSSSNGVINATSSLLLDKLLQVGSDCFGAALVKPKVQYLVQADIDCMQASQA